MFSPDYYEDARSGDEGGDEAASADAFSGESDFEVEDEYVRWYGNFEPTNRLFTADPPRLYVVGPADRAAAEGVARAACLEEPVAFVSRDEYEADWRLEFGELQTFPAYLLATRRGLHALDGGSAQLRAHCIRKIVQQQQQHVHQ